MEPLLRERVDAGIEVLRLNRPRARNAMDSQLLAALEAALGELAADPSLRVLVLSTTDTTALCAGADVREELDAAGGVARMEAFTRLYSALEAFPVPTIAVAVGNCVGAGAEVVAGCDLRVCGDNLKLAWAGARLGVPVGPARLTPLLGLATAKDLVLTGRVVDQAEARRLGLAQRVATADEAEAEALELARAVAKQDAAGIRRVLAMFRAFERTEERVVAENARLVAFQREEEGLPQAR